MLRAVLVDVGGTFVARSGCCSTSRCCLPCAACAAAAHCRASRQPGRASCRARRGRPSPRPEHAAVLRRAIQGLRVECTDVELVEVRRALCVSASPSVSLFPGATEFLEAVRALGLRCAVLSNVHVRGAAEYRHDFADLHVAHLIDAVVTSLDVGFRKPHPAIFDAALQEAGCPATACIMVGDSEMKDIQPAVARGMRAIRVAIEEPAPTASAAHAVVTSLAEAQLIVAEWAAGNGT